MESCPISPIFASDRKGPFASHFWPCFGIAGPLNGESRLPLGAAARCPPGRAVCRLPTRSPTCLYPGAITSRTGSSWHGVGVVLGLRVHRGNGCSRLAALLHRVTGSLFHVDRQAEIGGTAEN